MDKELVIVVPNENAAYAVVRSLNGLADEGSIELYSAIVITKQNGKVRVLQDALDVRAPLAPLLGMSTGALIGLLAGPVGAAVGAAIGAAAGLGGDLLYSGFAGDFLHDVSARLSEGWYAVVAAVFEDWTVPVDTAMAPYNAYVLRQGSEDVAIAQIRAELKSADDELAHVDAELAKASGEAKIKLEAKRDEIKAKQAAQRAKMRARADKLQEQWHARVESIKEKGKTAKADAKRRHEEHAQKLSHFADVQKQSFRELFS